MADHDLDYDGFAWSERRVSTSPHREQQQRPTASRAAEIALPPSISASPMSRVRLHSWHRLDRPRRALLQVNTRTTCTFGSPAPPSRSARWAPGPIARSLPRRTPGAPRRPSSWVALHGLYSRVHQSSWVVDTTSSFNTAATRHGLFSDDQIPGTTSEAGSRCSTADAIHPRPRKGAEYCYVRALDEMERLSSVTLYTYASSQLPQSSDDILEDILDYADVRPPPARHGHDPGARLLEPVDLGREGHRRNPQASMRKTGSSTSGHDWRLENRSHRTAAPHTGSLATVKESDDGTNPYFSELVWDDGAENIENMVFMRIRNATNQGAQTAGRSPRSPSSRLARPRTSWPKEDLRHRAGGDAGRKHRLRRQYTTGRRHRHIKELTVRNTADFNGKGTFVRVKFGATAGYLTLLKPKSTEGMTMQQRNGR